MAAANDPKNPHARWFDHDRFGMFIHGACTPRSGAGKR